ncbi:MAG: AAA family ATPase [Telluria sp.]
MSIPINSPADLAAPSAVVERHESTTPQANNPAETHCTPPDASYPPKQPGLSAPASQDTHTVPNISHAAAATAKVMARMMATGQSTPQRYTYLPPVEDQIPQALSDMNRWIVWRAEGPPGAKPTKIPYNPTLQNSRASVSDPYTWGTFEQAMAAYDEGGYTGVAIVLDGSGLVGIDLDGCVVNGVINPASRGFMDAVGATYIELSPSGTGLRAFGFAENLPSGLNSVYNGLKVEMYSSGRYLTVTGRHVENGPVGPFSGFRELAERIRSVKKTPSLDGESDSNVGDMFRQILTGEVYHDSLRDIAASWAGMGVPGGAIATALRSAMDASTAPHDDRWKARRDEILKLVNSAMAKFGPDLPGAKLYLPALIKSTTSVEASVRFSLMDSTAAALFVGKSKEVQWLVEDTLPTGKVIILASPPGVGKSFMSLDLAVAVTAPASTGPYNCFGGEVKVNGRAVIISAEDDVEELHRRIEALTGLRSDRMHVASLPDLGHFSFLQGDQRNGLTPTAKWADLKEQILGLDDVKLIVVDTLQALSAGDLNAAEIAQAMMDQLTELASQTGAAVIALHHLTKGTGATQGKGPLQGHAAMELIRGSGAIVGSARAAYCLLPHPDAKVVCEALGEEYEDGKVAYGLVAKANGKARRSHVIYVRDSAGVLRDRTQEYSGDIAKEDEDTLIKDLLTAVRDAHAQGNSYAVSGESKRSLHKRRRELPDVFHEKPARWFAEQIDALIDKGMLMKKTVTNGQQLAPPEDPDWDDFGHC